MEQTRAYLIDKFADGQIPTGTNFADFIDSALNLDDDGLTRYRFVAADGTPRTNYGFGGETAPECPIGIKGQEDGVDCMIVFTSNDGAQKWNINLNPSAADVPGFSIDDTIEGLSRFFIQPTTGFTGIGTITPEHKLHVEDTVETGYVQEKIRNAANPSGHPGWLFGQYAADNNLNVRDGSFAVVEDGVGIERFTILGQLESAISGVLNFAGINEMQPNATLHVSRPSDDPLQLVNLNENTGILLLGPLVGQHLGLDSANIQSRSAEVIGGTTTLSFSAEVLGIQPHGGNVNFFASVGLSQQIVMLDTGYLGVGKTSPQERLDLAGALILGNADHVDDASDGTMRWNGTDFQGRKGGTWVSLTSAIFTDGIWTQPGGTGTDLIYFNPTNPKVGIGTTTPAHPLDIDDNSSIVDGNGIAVSITSEATTSSTAFSATRIGMNISNTGAWSTNINARNVGLYVFSDGQVAHEANLAAVMNGNVVVGALTSEAVIGANGRNVLAIQTGDVPTAAPGTTTLGGIQIYSDDLTITGGLPDVSVVHFMNGNGAVVRLYEQPALDTPLGTVPNSGDPDTNTLIDNMRTRINQLENRLQTLGLLG